MTIQTLARAIKIKKPAVINEDGAPRYVVLDWETYAKWQEWKEDMEDRVRFGIAERRSEGKKRHSLAEVKKRYGFA